MWTQKRRLLEPNMILQGQEVHCVGNNGSKKNRISIVFCGTSSTSQPSTEEVEHSQVKILLVFTGIARRLAKDQKFVMFLIRCGAFSHTRKYCLAGIIFTLWCQDAKRCPGEPLNVQDSCLIEWQCCARCPHVGWMMPWFP